MRADRRTWQNSGWAIGILAVVVTAGVLTPGASAKRVISGSCNPAKAAPSIPCVATEGQSYEGYFVPDGAEDTEPTVEAVLGYIKREETDVTPAAFGLSVPGNDEFDIEYPKPDSDNDSFHWKYSGEAPLAFATVWSDEGGFALYDVFKKTEGTIDVAPELNGLDHVLHISFWQRTVSECDPVKVADAHGTGMLPGCQLSEVVNGRVPCVHVLKEKVRTCKFKTGRKDSGSWVEGVVDGERANFAMGGQAVSRKGKPNGAWVVASKTVRSGDVPCRKVTKQDRRQARRIRRGVRAPRDTASYASDGTLPGTGYTEVNGSEWNAINGNRPVPNPVTLKNFATIDVCAAVPPPHPDNAPYVGRYGDAYCYRGAGAGMNDIYGMERYSPAGGGLYIDDPYHRHFVSYTAATVAGAKRQNTKPDGTVILNSKIVWRTVAPRATLANDQTPPRR